MEAVGEHVHQLRSISLGYGGKSFSRNVQYAAQVSRLPGHLLKEVSMRAMDAAASGCSIHSPHTKEWRASFLASLSLPQRIFPTHAGDIALDVEWLG